MHAVVIDPPADVIAERHRLGLDLFDEVWDGEYHMVPPPMGEHQRLGSELTALLLPVAKRSGLVFRFESFLGRPGVEGYGDYRAPDLVVAPPERVVDRGFEGAVSLVVEIRSPRDESFLKLPFYESLGVGEVLIIDRDSKEVRRWVNGASGLVESAPGPDGRHALDCLPIALWSVDEVLHVEIAGEVTAI